MGIGLKKAQKEGPGMLPRQPKRHNHTTMMRLARAPKLCDVFQICHAKPVTIGSEVLRAQADSDVSIFGFK